MKVAVANGRNRKIPDEDEQGLETCSQLTPLLSIIAKADASRGVQFARWNIESEYPYWQASPYSELDEVVTDGSVEDVLALIPKYPQIEDEIRWRAYLKASSEGDVELARKIATEVRDPERKQRLLDDLNEDRTVTSDKNEKFVELDKYMAEIKRTEQKVIFLAAAANQIGAKDREAAIKLLNQASQIVDTMKPGREQLMSQMGLALVYCYLKSDRGLSIMQSLVPKLNELVEASAKLDGIEHRYLRDGEWNMTGEGTLGEILTGLAQNAGYFARCDFDRAVSLASQFDRPEIRIMAQLKLAQGVLAGPAKPLPFNYSYYR
jgi:hypothetical protein